MELGKYYFVPVIIEGRAKYEFEAHTIGVFEDVPSAVCALADELLELGYLRCDDSDEADSEYAASFTKQLNEARTEEQLDSLCDNYNDSYYGEGWKWRIDHLPVIRTGETRK